MKQMISLKESRLKSAIVDLLINIPIFDELKPAELSIISDYMNILDIEKGEILFREGDKGDYVCFVVEGEINIIKESEEGSSVVLSTISKGLSIGEMSCIDNAPRSASTKARTNATLVILTQNGFDKIVENHPRIGVKVLKKIARLLSFNLRKTSGQFADNLLMLSRMLKKDKESPRTRKKNIPR